MFKAVTDFYNRLRAKRHFDRLVGINSSWKIFSYTGKFQYRVDVVDEKLKRRYFSDRNIEARMKKLLVFFASFFISCHVFAFDVKPELLKLDSMSFKSFPQLSSNSLAISGESFHASEVSQLRCEGSAELESGLPFGAYFIVKQSSAESNDAAKGNANESKYISTSQEFYSQIIMLIGTFFGGLYGCWLGANWPVSDCYGKTKIQWFPGINEALWKLKYTFSSETKK